MREDKKLFMLLLQQVQEEHNKILTGVKLNKEKEIVKLKEEIETDKQKMSHELKRTCRKQI